MIVFANLFDVYADNVQTIGMATWGVSALTQFIQDMCILFCNVQIAASSSGTGWHLGRIDHDYLEKTTRWGN